VAFYSYFELIHCTDVCVCVCVRARACVRAHVCTHTHTVFLMGIIILNIPIMSSDPVLLIHFFLRVFMICYSHT
jgi:hypothetical protein